MNNLLVTGASGFVGRNLTPYLQNKGHTVFPLSLRSEKWRERFSQLSVDAVIHLAGKAHDTTNTSDPAAYFSVNTELTRQLFAAFLQSDARDFIYFSSVKAVADRVSGTLTEEHPARPRTPHGQSKHRAESLLLAQPLPEGRRLFILRPCMIYGPGNKGNLNLLYQLVKKGIPYPLAAFDNKRSFLSIDNLCYIVDRLLADRSMAGGVYQLADDQPLATTELIQLMAAAGVGSGRMWRIPKGIVRLAARLGDGLRLPLTSERLQKLTENYVVSNAKIRKALRIDRLPLSVEEGLRRTLRKFE